MNSITPIGVTNFRNIKRKFGIKDSDRLNHIYCIGKTGVGKSTLLMNMAYSDISRGNGLCIIDPHGEIAEELRHKIPDKRRADVYYFDPKDLDNALALNPLIGIEPRFHHLVASSLVATFKKIWADSWGPRMEYILRYCLLTLLLVPESTMLDIQKLLTDDEFRKRALDHVTDTNILAFWLNEFEKYPSRLKMEAISPILNKAGIFNASAPLRATIGQKTRGIRMQHIMDNRKILICNLTKGELGEDVSALLGSVILTLIQHAALFRSRLSPEQRVPFYCYIDEMHSFLTLSFVNILSESRKYGLSLFLTHQYIEQLDERIRSAIFGNVGTIISFRVGAVDAEYLAKEFSPVFTDIDLVSLPRFSIYLKLMIDGATSVPFSANTLAAF